MKNIFFALKISDNKKFSLFIQQLEIQLRHEEIHCDKANQLFINLRELGDCDEKTIEKLKQTAEIIAEDRFCFELGIKGIATNRRSMNPGFIVAKVTENPRLEKLIKAIESSIRAFGYVKDKLFEPNVLLARFEDIEHKQRFAKIMRAFKANRLLTEEMGELMLIERTDLPNKAPSFKVLGKYKFKTID